MPDLKRILAAGTVVPAARNVFAQFRHSGHQVEFVPADGTDIIERCKVFRPDLIILEVPLKSAGFWTGIIRSVRNLPVFTGVAILVYSNYVTTDDDVNEFRKRAIMIDALRKQFLRAGADLYLGPFEEHAFMKKLLPYL